MSPRALRALAACLLALAGAWAARTAWERRQAAPELLAPGASQAVRLTLRGPAGAVTLEKEAGAWRLKEPFAFPADGAKVTAFLGTLAKARLSAPLSDDPARFGLFGVGAASATRVTAEFAAGRPLDVYLGLPGAASDTLFLRRAGSDAVREARGLGRWEADPKPGAWADRVVAALDGSRVTALRLKSSKGVVELARDGGRWRREGWSPALSAKAGAGLQALLTVLTRFEADEVSAGTPAFKPELEVRVSALKASGDGSETVLELSAGPLDKTYRRPVRAAGKDGVVYWMANWRLEPFMLGPGDLR